MSRETSKRVWQARVDPRRQASHQSLLARVAALNVAFETIERSFARA